MTYAGDVSPQEAYEAIASDQTAVIVDVRTRPELSYVGHPNLSAVGKQLITIEWQTFPTGEPNAGFIDELVDNGVGPEQPVYFLCRSGARSQAAAIAATAAGFVSAFNISDGFEGPLDENGHRGIAAGWQASGLPWSQS